MSEAIFKFICPYCGETTSAPKSGAGTKDGCSNCSGELIIPRPKNLSMQGKLQVAQKFAAQVDSENVTRSRSGAPRVSEQGSSGFSTQTVDHAGPHYAPETPARPAASKQATGTGNWKVALSLLVTVCVIAGLAATIYLRPPSTPTHVEPEEAIPSDEVLYNLFDAIVQIMQRAENSQIIMENDKLTLAQLEAINNDGRLDEQSRILKGSIQKREISVQYDLQEAAEKTAQLVEYHKKWPSHTDKLLQKKLGQARDGASGQSDRMKYIYSIVIEAPDEASAIKPYLKSRVLL